MSRNGEANRVQDFIARWKESAAAERANYQLFLSELCDVLGVPRPEPTQADDERNAYVFERAVTFQNGDGTVSTGRIDLYKRGCFVLEAKQGSDLEPATAPLFDATPVVATRKRRRGRKGTAVRGSRGWDVAMGKARGQAEQYVRALPVAEGNPPFVVVVDVGYTFELYSDFSRAGKTYVPFPDPRSHRILIADLEQEEIRERLRLLWTEPLALDPSRQSARVTRRMAERLALLARSLEAAGYEPERVAQFLMRAIFTMFAEDMRLLPERGWTGLLESLQRGGADKFTPMVSSLWETMNAGGFSPIMREDLLRFNGGLFESVEALPLSEPQLELLIEASRLDWRDVEPAIFGTLLERALNPLERKMLGAHYTPRAYVERLVLPTVIEPLREEWGDTLAAAVRLHDDGQDAEAAQAVKEFHRRLCRVRVLDPACGSGNFLYVTLEHLKRLEGEVLDALHGFGEAQGILEDTGMTVDPHQLLGIELNPRAAAIADLVLWIGYLQWHFRTRGEAQPPEPVLKKFDNIEGRDAVLAYDAIEAVTDDDGRAVTRWDGRTYKKSAVTGEDVPDETAREPVMRYTNARKAEWPEADFIIGNPPFIGARRIRSTISDEYVETLRETYEEVPETSDFVMFWWHKAALAVEEGRAKRFGFITTNSIVQSYSRGIIEKHLSGDDGIALIYAIPDHPWIDATDGADVRVAMTVAVSQRIYSGKSILEKVVVEGLADGELILSTEEVPFINSRLRSDFDASQTKPLLSNKSMCFSGVMPGGAGFKLRPEEVIRLGIEVNHLPKAIKKYMIGRDIVQLHDEKYIIDFCGLTEAEARGKSPALYQIILDKVKPERDQNRREARRRNWWLFSECAPNLRRAISGLSTFIVTPNTSKHRPFVFVNGDVLPDITIYAVASDDAYFLGILSSSIHANWSFAVGGKMGVGNDSRYNSKSSFEPFPFPDATDEQKARVRELGEALDAHRKRQQAQHPRLTVTEMYNVLEKLRAREPLTEKDRLTNEAGLVSGLKQIHDDLDAAVSDAYGWPATLSDEEILERLVGLNAVRAREEREGSVRWLRPEFQKPAAGVAATFGEGFEAAAAVTTTAAAKEKKQPWPKTLPEQARALRQVLAARKGVVTAKELARSFVRARVERIEELLQTLVSLGQAREVGAGRFTV